MTPAGRGVLGGLAFVLGLGALLAGEPAARAGPGRGAPDPVAALPAEARIAPTELARRIKARDRRLLLVDLRGAQDYESYHVPTARHLPLPELSELSVQSGDLVVLYGAGGPGILEAREALLSSGAGEVRILEGGVAGWLREVMNPTLAADAGREEREAFLDAAEVSRYFGGVPRIVPREELEADPGSVAEIVEDMRLRGCRGG